jgi:hypothetical protein
MLVGSMLGGVHREVFTLGDDLDLAARRKHSESLELEKAGLLCHGKALRTFARPQYQWCTLSPHPNSVPVQVRAIA